MEQNQSSFENIQNVFNFVYKKWNFPSVVFPHSVAENGAMYDLIILTQMIPMNTRKLKTQEIKTTGYAFFWINWDKINDFLFKIFSKYHKE